MVIPNIPNYEMGRRAVEILLQKIGTCEATEIIREKVQPRLVVQRSTQSAKEGRTNDS